MTLSDDVATTHYRTFENKRTGNYSYQRPPFGGYLHSGSPKGMIINLYEYDICTQRHDRAAGMYNTLMESNIGIGN